MFNTSDEYNIITEFQTLDDKIFFNFKGVDSFSNSKLLNSNS